MVSEVARSLLEQQGKPCYLVVVTITNVSPLTVTYLGTAGVLAAAKWTGCTYVLGAAVAIASSPGKPIVLPNG